MTQEYKQVMGASKNLEASVQHRDVLPFFGFSLISLLIARYNVMLRTMTTMISEVYEAFITAGVPRDKARQAAEALSAENLATKADISLLDKRMDGVHARTGLLKWMPGFNLAFTMTILRKIFS